MLAVVTVVELVQLHARNNTILLTVFGFVGSKRPRIKWSGSHCEKPGCFAVCPVKAYSIEPDGLVVQDHSKCIGCQACIAACPFKAPVFDGKSKKVFKCDGCVQLLAQGKRPACVQACTQGALQFGPIEELRKKYPEAVVAGFEWAAKNFGYASPKETGPRLVIVPLN